MGRVEGKVVLITGAARGQGASHARRLAAEGATVVVTDVLDELGSKVAADLGCRYEHLDVRQAEHWTRVLDLIQAEHGRLDVLINNAGVLQVGTLEQTTLSDYLEVIAVNQVGCFLGMQAALPALRAAPHGSIINISSSAAMNGSALLTAYSASKWAVRGMTKCAAIELGPDRIRVNSVHPGTVRTPMTDGPHDLDEMCSGLPVPRAAEPDEISGLVLFLSSDESVFCTGSEFVIDGGFTAGMPAALFDQALSDLT
jgi:3alpha(or 20beta)-hydroxysteroid dehydrogenase